MRVTLDEVCTKATSKYAQKDLANMTGEYPVFGASGFIKNIGVYQQEKTYVAVVKDGAGIGRTMLLPGKSSVIGTMQYLLPKENVLPKFLYYAVKSMHLEKYYTGATIPHIYFKDYKKETFDLPEDTRQKEIINIFDKVELIIQSRKLQLKALDELVKSRFIEMFGDPISNPKRWDTISLGKRCKIITGNTPSRAESENYGNFIEWIKSDNINTPFTLLTNAQECLSEIGFQKCRFVEAGSLLMTCIAGSINCIGNVAISNRRVAFNQQINAIVPEEDEVLYLYWLMLLSKPIIHHTINKSLKGILSKGQLSEISFPFPPREIQKQFVAFATQIDKSRLLFKCQLLQYHSIEHIIRGRNYG